MSMDEANNGILAVFPQDDLWNELAPESWKSKPKAYVGEVYQWNDENNERHIAFIIPCIKECAGEFPTKEEAQELIDQVKAKGEPVAFLTTLASLHVPMFPEDKDPTVKEFLEGAFDPSTLSVKTVLVIYPAIEEIK